MAEFFDWQTCRETLIARVNTQCPLSTIEMILLEKYHMINIDNLNEAEEKEVVAPYRSGGGGGGGGERNAIVRWMGVANLFSLAYQAE